MKHIIITLLVSFALGSCTKDLKYEIQSITKTIRYNETLQLKMNQGINGDYLWKCSDEFVGAVSVNGLFTASHIGEATITAEKEGRPVASITIKVQPSEDFFEEPYIDWNATHEIIKAKEKRVLVQEDKYSLKYFDPSPVLKDSILYAFSQGHPFLAGVMVKFHHTQANETKVKTFYAERYREVESYATTILYVDRHKKNLIIMDIDPIVGLVVTYNYNGTYH